ncbi:MAG TPA: EF-P lysine aminoacylase EpmA [Rhizomicrobium sp.]|jgi:lysyl-tRNA synthetase class 2|nr:EF-P lysine aminoacylase EpmA [Rhizomicrobium sp.]
MPPDSWWTTQRHTDRRPALLARGRIRNVLRQHFEREGFLEVECAILQHSPGNEAHLHAFATERIAAGGARETLYLRTSPEFACKKLIAAGERRIFEFARVFRNREQGALHAPEFTMLEWYRAEEDYQRVMADCIDVLRTTAEAVPARTLSFRGRPCDPLSAPERLTVADAFRRLGGIDLLSTLSDEGEGDRDALAAAAEAAGLETAPNDGWSDIFSKLLVARIEPNLGRERPTLLYEYPRCEAALARAAPHDPRIAERFELYACGVELANGFGELTDAAEQRRRFEAEMAEKQRIFGERYPLDEDLLAALPHMPRTSGAALGFDRLVMLALGAPHIEDVIWTPAGARE